MTSAGKLNFVIELPEEAWIPDCTCCTCRSQCSTPPVHTRVSVNLVNRLPGTFWHAEYLQGTHGPAKLIHQQCPRITTSIVIIIRNGLRPHEARSRQSKNKNKNRDQIRLRKTKRARIRKRIADRDGECTNASRDAEGKRWSGWVTPNKMSRNVKHMEEKSWSFQMKTGVTCRMIPTWSYAWHTNE